MYTLSRRSDSTTEITQNKVEKMDKLSFRETSQPADAHCSLAADGSSVISHLTVPNTLYDSRKAFQKVVPVADDAEADIAWFFSSGRTACMEDIEASLNMMEKGIPRIHSETGNFGFLFSKDLKAEHSHFEDNINFKLRHEVGSGVAGVVQAFCDTTQNRKFVRKRLKAKSLRLEEVQSLLRLQHPGVCKVYALLCHGPNLDLLLQDAGFPLRDCLVKFVKSGISSTQYWQVVKDLSRQGFEALHYIHNRDICHLDIKPENILVHQNAQKNLVLVVADFGSSLSLGDVMTLKLQMTPEYWAPEMWKHAAHFLETLRVNKHSKPADDEFPPSPCLDTFAMGLVVYFMASLKHLVLAEKEKYHAGASPVSVQDVERLGKLFDDKLEEKFAFNFMLMSQHCHLLPDLASKGQWKFGGIPSVILDVMTATLHPDPNKRWNDAQSARCLCGIQVLRDKDLKTPTPVADSTDDLDTGNQIAWDHKLPAREMQASPSASRDPTEPTPLNGTARFQQKIAPLLRPWDNIAYGSPQAPPLQGLPVDPDARNCTASFPSKPVQQLAMSEDIAVQNPQSKSALLGGSGVQGQDRSLCINQTKLPEPTNTIHAGLSTSNIIHPLEDSSFTNCTDYMPLPNSFAVHVDPSVSSHVMPLSALSSFSHFSTNNENHRPHLGLVKGLQDIEDREEDMGVDYSEAVDVDMGENVRSQQIVPDPAVQNQIEIFELKGKLPVSSPTDTNISKGDDGFGYARKMFDGNFERGQSVGGEKIQAGERLNKGLVQFQVSCSQSNDGLTMDTPSIESFSNIRKHPIHTSQGKIGVKKIGSLPVSKKLVSPSKKEIKHKKLSLGGKGSPTIPQTAGLDRKWIGAHLKPPPKLGGHGKRGKKALMGTSAEKADETGNFSHAHASQPGHVEPSAQCVNKFPFVVASSGRRNPTTHTLHGVSLGNSTPPTYILSKGYLAMETTTLPVLATAGPKTEALLDTSLMPGTAGLETVWSSDAKRPVVMSFLGNSFAQNSNLPDVLDTQSIVQRGSVAFPGSNKPFSHDDSVDSATQRGVNGQTSIAPDLYDILPQNSQQLTGDSAGVTDSILIEELVSLLENSPAMPSAGILNAEQGGAWHGADQFSHHMEVVTTPSKTDQGGEGMIGAGQLIAGSHDPTNCPSFGQPEEQNQPMDVGNVPNFDMIF